MRFADIMSTLSGAVVAGFGLFLLGLAVLITTMPAHAEGVLRGFASSALTHYAEQGVRVIVGAVILNFAGSMQYPALFTLFGWLIIVTRAALLLIPWRWHNRFATLVMPPVFRQMRLFARGAFALGAFVLYSACGVVAA